MSCLFFWIFFFEWEIGKVVGGKGKVLGEMNFWFYCSLKVKF